MDRKALKLSAAALLALTFGCKNAEEKRVDERNEANKEMAKAQENLNEERREAANQPGDEDEQEDVIEARRNLHEEQNEAAREVAKADAQMDRFEAYKPGESTAAFASRAQTAIDQIGNEVAKMESKVGTVPADKQGDVRDELADAREASAEARKDLEQIQSGDGGVIDDGKTGVTVAINRARRSLEDAREEIADTETVAPNEP